MFVDMPDCCCHCGGVQWWLGVVEQWLLEVLVVGGGGDAAEGGLPNHEDMAHQRRGKELSRESMKFDVVNYGNRE